MLHHLRRPIAELGRDATQVIDQGEEVLGRPGAPHQHDGGSEKPRVERSDHCQDEDLRHTPA